MTTLRILILSCVTLAAPACEREAPAPSSVTAEQTKRTDAEPPRTSETFRFGHVSLDDGPRKLEHVFRIANTRTSPVRIVKVHKTCGCVDTAVDKMELSAGEGVTLTLAMTLEESGSRTQGASLIFSDGSMNDYNLSAIGVRGLELVGIVDSPDVGPGNLTLPVRLYLIDSTGNGTNSLPIVLSPSGVGVSFDQWHTLESHEDLRFRSNRQVGNALLDFSHYEGSWPVPVTITTSCGATCGATCVVTAYRR
jgi:Protein of unknown function (DUF1573)